MSESPPGGIVLNGGCYCGAVRYTVRPEALPTEHNFCHCRTCQLISGSAFLPFVSFPASCVDTFATPPEALTAFEASEFARREFCNICGSTLSMRYYAGGDRISFTVGSFDEESAKLLPQPNVHIYLSEKATWYPLNKDDGAEHHQTMKRAAEYLGGRQRQSA